MSTPDFLLALLRLQFGVSASFHFLFVPLSLGLLLCVNVLQTQAILRGGAHLDRASRFWRRFFALSWVIGVCTGYPLRFQLQDNWGNYTESAMPVLERIFAIEGAIAPFMLASVLVLLLGRRLVGRYLHMASGWILLGLLCMQAWTILSVNAWMQNPVGVQFGPGSWRLESLSAILFSDTTLHKLWHTLSAAFVCGAVFVIATSAGFILRRQHMDVALSSFAAASWIGVVGVLSTAWSGHESAHGVAQHQPMKFAAMEGLWTREPGPAGLVLFGVPDPDRGLNQFEVKVPYLMSLLLSEMPEGPLGVRDLIERDRQALLNVSLADDSQFSQGWSMLAKRIQQRDADAWANASDQQQAQWMAQETVPSVTPLFAGFRVMALIGLLLAAACFLGAASIKAIRLGHRRWVLHLLKWSLPLPWVAILAGWMVAEVGRQPWVIYGRVSTHHALTAPSVDVAVLGVATMLFGGVLLSCVTWWAGKSILRAGPECDNWAKDSFAWFWDLLSPKRAG